MFVFRVRMQCLRHCVAVAGPGIILVSTNVASDVSICSVEVINGGRKFSPEVTLHSRMQLTRL